MSGQEFGRSGFFAMRSPLLPLETFWRWGEGLRCGTGERGVSPETYQRDRRVLQRRLRRILDDEVVREALFVASPSLSDRLGTWVSDPDSPKGRQSEVG